MSTKYSVSPQASWSLDKPELNSRPWTDHALNRYDERTPDWSPSPEHAYEHSTSLDTVIKELNGDDGTPDDARFYATWNDDHSDWFGVVFVNSGGCLVSCIDLRKLQNRPLRAYLSVLAREEGFL